MQSVICALLGGESMWFILRASDEVTLATTQYMDVAYIITTSFECECVMRFVPINDRDNSNKNAAVSAKAAIA